MFSMNHAKSTSTESVLFERDLTEAVLAPGTASVLSLFSFTPPASDVASGVADP